MSKDLYKTLTYALIGALLGGAPGYFLIVPTRITRAEAIEIVRQYSPYVPDKNSLIIEIKHNREKISRIQVTLDRIEKQIKNGK